jgi:hypothetical protein
LRRWVWLLRDDPKRDDAITATRAAKEEGEAVIQISKRTEDMWDVTSCEPIDGGHEYELIGRIIQEDIYFVIALARWSKFGCEFEPQPHRFYLLSTAAKAIESAKKGKKEKKVLQ